MISRKKHLNFPHTDANLLESFSKTSIENLLLLDIETTGFSWKNSMVFLIGFMKIDSACGRWVVEQRLLEDPAMEKELLAEFSHLITANTCLVHYNGRRFDLPFLEGRCQMSGIPVTWNDCGQLDLYQTLRPCRKLLGLERMRLPDLEERLGLSRPEDISKKTYISVFQKYAAQKNPELEEILFLHNQWNLIGILQAACALAYPAFLSGKFSLESHDACQDSFVCRLSPRHPFPRSFLLDCHPRPWTVSGDDRQAQIKFSLENGCLRMYYPNYKDYYYLPAEDAAIHKSVGVYVDKKNRVPATAENCFTRFPCSIDFMQNPRQIEDYIRRCL